MSETKSLIAAKKVKNGGRQLVKNGGREWPKEELRKSSIEARISPINRNPGRKEKIRREM